MTDTRQLLEEYVENGSETAFCELVARYVGLVYSAAVRLLDGDAHLAQDVTQIVFTDLARGARMVSRQAMLGGWLHRHTCYVASKVRRSERRRLARERQAVEMNNLQDHSAVNLALIAPILDDAINRLGTEDRAAILLRFFEQNDYRSVGEALGTSEEAARKRVDRALGKLELTLRKRGIALPSTALGTTLITQAVTAAPAGLAASISAGALASAAVGGGTALTILRIMSMTKLKVGIISAIVLAGVTVPLVVTQQRTEAKLRGANAALQRQTEQISQLTAEAEQFSNQLMRAAASPAAQDRPSGEILRLRGEVGSLRRQAAEEKPPVTRDTVEARYRRAQELARTGDAQGALNEFLWCFDEGMPRVPSYVGVRLSYVLDSIAKLGEKYPQALLALAERRDKASQRMLASTNDFDASMEFAAINRVLKEDQNTLAVFDQLPADDPRRQILASAAYEQLIEAQRYGDALSGKSYGQMKMSFDAQMMAIERPLPTSVSNPELVRKGLRGNLITSGAKNVEVLAGSGDLDHARALAVQLLTFDNSAETKALLQQHAARASQPDLLNNLPNP